MNPNIEIKFEPGFKDCTFSIEKIWFYKNKLYVLSSLKIPEEFELDAHAVLGDTASLFFDADVDVNVEYEVVHYLIVSSSDMDCKDLKFLKYDPNIISTEDGLPEFIQKNEAQLLYDLIKLPADYSGDTASDEVDPEITRYFRERSSDESEAEPEAEVLSERDETDSDNLSVSLGITRDNSFKPVVIKSSAANQNPSCFSFRALTFFAAATAIGGLALIQQTCRQPKNS